MTIVKKGKVTKLIADENMRITNKSRTFFVEFMYLAKNDSVDNYEEVGKEIWYNAITKTDVNTNLRIAELENTVENLKNAIAMLEDIALNVDLRVLNIENDKEN